MVPTSDTSEVIVDILVKSGGVDLLSVEVLEVLLKDLICSLVSLAKVLQDLQRKKIILVMSFKLFVQSKT